MLIWAGLIILLVVVVLLVGVFWRIDDVIEDEAPANDGLGDGEGDRIVTEVAAAQRLRREAAATEDAEERARLIKLADEADGTAEKIRQGVLSDE